uniref:Membrane-associated guanylate kinase, WW and PDZ domain-containing protein 1-like n=1 Tax=Heterorhabditis bacteriophora TaxID=37862 RepID=A0A1I7XR35_HETBA
MGARRFHVAFRMEESQMQIQEKTAVEETADDEADDQDSAIDLSKEIDELSKLQITLENMMGCPRSPSTSVASSGRDTGSSGRDTGASTSGDKEEPKKNEICDILADKQWLELHVVIRDNLYRKTVPYTTRPAREGEIDGEHYRFVSVEEFTRLQHQGFLLEHGTYQGVFTDSNLSDLYSILMTCKSLVNSHSADTKLSNRIFLFSLVQMDDDNHLYGTPRPVECYEDEMVSSAAKGPLPPNWEIGYLDNGDKYFIDHNSATTTWDDPRDLPVGWEQVDDPDYGTFFVESHQMQQCMCGSELLSNVIYFSSCVNNQNNVDSILKGDANENIVESHINKKTQYERPCLTQPLHSYDTLPSTASYQHHNGIIVNDTATNYSPSHQSRRINGGTANGCNSLFTKDPSQLRGEMITTTIIKGPKGLGFTLIGNDASSKGDEFIQVKSVLPGGPAAENGVLRPGDVIVRVNGELLLGASQADACRIFVGIPIKDPVTIQICRGYPLMLDPSNRIITENVYTTGGRSRDLHEIEISKGTEGFGFTIADSVSGQRVKKILYPAQCPNLMEGDTIVELDGRNVRATPHTQLVDMLRECSVGHRGRLVVKRSSPKHRSEV